MIYQTRAEWLAASQKKVLFFGMSGLGKTYLSAMLRAWDQQRDVLQVAGEVWRHGRIHDEPDEGA